MKRSLKDRIKDVQVASEKNSKAWGIYHELREGVRPTNPAPDVERQFAADLALKLTAAKITEGECITAMASLEAYVEGLVEGRGQA